MPGQKCKKSKKVRDFENVSLPLRQRMQPYEGINCSRMREAVPNYDQAGCETVYPSNPSPTNAWIVIGRDRPHVKASGEGGKGHTQCGSIDLVAGRLSWEPKDDIVVNPRFYGPNADAARIYITQRAGNIDQYMHLAGPQKAENKSAIAMKADAVRIVARQGIKLVTMPPYDREALSTGCDLKTQYGIDLCAGNVDGSYAPPGRPLDFRPSARIKFLQPIPLGDNLVRCLEKLTDELDDLGTRVHKFIVAQMSYNRSISAHRHIGGLLPDGQTGPSDTLIPKGLTTDVKQFVKCSGQEWTRNLNLSKFKTNHLTPKGTYWICSRMNRTT